MKIKNLIIVSLGVCSSLIAAPSMRDFALDQNYPQNLVINNRILLKMEGKVITVMDVARKMDLLFYRQYPEMTSNPMARYQFYMSGWRTVLGGVIDDCLIMADAKEKQVVVNDGEIRETLENLFGPDVVINIDKLGMTFDEAFELIKTEMTVQRMASGMARSKALAEVHPQAVKKRYQKFLSEHPPQTFWVYQILSIRGEEHERVAQEAYRLIQEQGISFKEIASKIGEEGVEISCSEEYRQNERELSLAYRAVLQTLAAGNASTPVSSSKGSRLFCLGGIEKEETPSFNQVAEELKSELMQEAMTRYNDEYRKKLRKNAGLTDKYLSQLIPDSVKPFELR